MRNLTINDTMASWAEVGATKHAADQYREDQLVIDVDMKVILMDIYIVMSFHCFFFFFLRNVTSLLLN